MEIFFTILLGVGIGCLVIGLFVGDLSGGGDFDVNARFPLKPVVIAVFIAVFGGAGLVLIRLFAPLTAIPLSGLIAVAVSYLLCRFVIIPLARAQSTTAIEIQSLIGHIAKVSEKIPQGQYGKITYKVNDSTYNAPAKSEDGNEIARGSYVEIIYIEKNTYYVRQT